MPSFNLSTAWKLLGLSLMLGACQVQDYRAPKDPSDNERFGFGSLLGGDGLVLSRNKPMNAEVQKPSNRVNLYLWKAALEVSSSLPLSSVDAFSGIILTDWYSLPGYSDERVKIKIYVRDAGFRSDTLAVSVYKEKRNSKGEWESAFVPASTIRELEDVILTKARELHVRSLS